MTARKVLLSQRVAVEEGRAASLHNVEGQHAAFLRGFAVDLVDRQFTAQNDTLALN